MNINFLSSFKARNRHNEGVVYIQKNKSYVDTLPKKVVFANASPQSNPSKHEYPELSLIIPTWNEAANIAPLVYRINSALTGIKYELIFVDDHSSDDTVNQIRRLERNYPIRVFMKKGQQGKAFSLLEGFRQARADLVGFIDADLQYPPESLTHLLAPLKKGESDIVVANRVRKDDKIRIFFSLANRVVFARWLYGLDCDVQSGLKIFRRPILNRIQLNPTSWTFDLEFLTKAKSAGYKISSVDISFMPRLAERSKVNLFKTSLEVGIGNLKTRFAETPVAPFTAEMVLKEGQGFHYRGKKFISHSPLGEGDSAVRQVTLNQKVFGVILALALIDLLLFNWHATVVLLFTAITLFYFSDLLFSLTLIFKAFNKPEIGFQKWEIALHSNRSWPLYTIFCPLYKEGEVLVQFVEAIEQLDYPKDRLQVMLLLEEDDPETLQKAKNLGLPSYFEVKVVPHSSPKTKPKACNYGLTKAYGEYSVIYDAEDIPDPDQLKKAVLAFERAGADVACVQAKLNFYNSNQNLLTKIFTAEYSLWFDLILPGLQSVKAPIPLGGTSNHFKTDKLRELGGWDAFNVTEDCDLGIRLARRGYGTAIVDSTTLEEANSSYTGWVWQRSRWIKGYIQTYLVHMRFPIQFWQSNRLSFLAFQLVVGGKILSLFINPLMWLITISYFLFRPVLGTFIESFFPPLVLYLGVFSLVAGNFLYLYYYMIGLVKRGKDGLVPYAYLVPIYWLAISVAAWLALYKLISNPYQWSKTKHGLHLNQGKEQLVGVRGTEVVTT